MKITHKQFTVVTTLRDPDFFHANYYWYLCLGTNNQIFLDQEYPITFREEEVLSIGLSYVESIIGGTK